MASYQRVRAAHPSATPARHQRVRATFASTASVLAVLAALAIAGCGGEPQAPPIGPGEPPATTTTATGTESPEPTADIGKMRIVVEMTEFSLNIPGPIAPGTYTLVAQNTGNAPHALKVEGPGLDDAETEVVPPGESAELEATLAKGKYEFTCPVGNHEEQGMKVSLRVG